MQVTSLQTLGWHERWQEPFAPYAERYTLGRVSLEHKHMYRVMTEEGDLLGEVSGKLRHEASGREDYPAVGDFVLLEARASEGKATIHGILPRFSKFSRKAAGNTTEEQIVASNVDTVFLVNALNNDFNLRRIERYLILAWESGASPVIVLSKADLCEEATERAAEVEAVAIGVPVHVVSAWNQEGIEALTPYVSPGRTVALLGSSGAGKSTLINLLLGEPVQEVQGIREGDDRGRHTTTYRELFVMPGGGLLVDTPGMRELQLWHADEGLGDTFAEIEELAAGCKFADCRHEREPGCAVREGLLGGALRAERYESYKKTQRELAFLAAKDDVKLRLQQKERWKKLTSSNRNRVNRK
ncbi:GTPase RsgA [Paenibacillus swuensis]|uniref:Small ribosomal subunit biogenesis GTPase RsgA n=1 Tax=Paenibacillus swuensis TaxID=1178515 RepID=A0A172TGR0_9BACL|nr:ribosome small subunit-dependent GTPase A [Paenibacillus swuensis]ANE46200.1 GTPase RsgA [Paenibacillus swuensis]